MLPIMWQSMMKHGIEQKGGKMKTFIVALFTVLLMFAMNTGDWIAYVLVMAGFMLTFYYLNDLE